MVCGDFEWFVVVYGSLRWFAVFQWVPGRFAPNPFPPPDVSAPGRFAPGRFAPGRFAPTGRFAPWMFHPQITMRVGVVVWCDGTG